ncbi:restriction endonuclease PLD domain-containing protein [Vibrio vulnificus]|uniref:restriction endonuclease PLD domain-containing protein n=1 Tax=Vibrio vulnificus TaxID=672 RepID=UPI0009B7FFAD
MLYTNIGSHGGNFDTPFHEHLKRAHNVKIASGYFSLDILQKYEPLLLEKAQHHQCQILLGMAFYEGLSQKQFDLVEKLNTQMLTMGAESGFYVTNGRKCHGKIFQLNGKTFLGSSNFSSSGFKADKTHPSRCGSR